MPPLAVCQCLPIYVEHLCLLDVTSIFSSEQQKARDQTPSVDTANFANEFDDGAATPPVDPLIERASRKKGRPSFFILSNISSFRPEFCESIVLPRRIDEQRTTHYEIENRDERLCTRCRKPANIFFLPLSSKYGIVIYYSQ